MIKVIFCGCFGRMGNVVRQIVKEKDNIEIVAGVDICDGTAEFPVYKTITDVKESADVIIDFSSPKALDSILEYATGKNVPAPTCSVNSSSSTPLFFRALSTLVVKCNPAVGAATDPLILE